MDGTEDGENGETRDESCFEVVLSAKGLIPLRGSPLGGIEKRLMDLLTFLEEGLHHEGVGSASTLKGRKELKNLKCYINFDTRANGYSRGKGRAI
jgi:hypothetical protein